MTTLLDHIDSRATLDARPSTAAVTAPAQRLRATMAAVRLGFTWLGTQKSLTPSQRARAAEAFDAEGQFLSAGKKLLDLKHPAFRAVTAIRGKIQAYWKGISLPYPEPGLRLIRQDQVEEFAQQLAEFRVELDDAVQEYRRAREEAARYLVTDDPGGPTPEDLFARWLVEGIHQPAAAA